MQYQLKAIINGVEVFEMQRRTEVEGVTYSEPSIFDVVLQNNATLRTMELGATASDCLSFSMLNPFAQSFDGQQVDFFIKPITSAELSLKTRIEEAVGDSTTAAAISEAENNTNATPDEEESEELTPEELADVEATAEANIEDTFAQLEGEEDETTPGTPVNPEWRKLGVYYVQSQQTIGDNQIRLTCLDGFSRLNGLWTPANKSGTMLSLFNDLRAQALANCGISIDAFEFEETAMTWKTMSSYRDALGYFAGLAGGFAGFDSEGIASINFYGFTDAILIKDELLGYTEDSAGEMLLTEMTCNTSIDALDEKLIEAGAGQGVRFTNPYMTQEVLDAILADYSGLRFSGGTLRTRWDDSLLAGEFVKIYSAEEYDNYLRLVNAYNAGATDLKEAIGGLGTLMHISAQTIVFDGEAVSTIRSVCATEDAKESQPLSPSDAKFRNLYAQSITTEQLSAGSAEIQRLISENVDASQIRTGELDADVVNVKNINGNEIKSGTVLAAALSEEAVETFSGSKVYYQADEPTGGSYNVNDSWYKTVLAEGDTDVLHVWNGTEWEPKDLDAKLLQAGTITALEIASNTIEANNINMNNLQTNLARVGDTDEKHIVIDSDSVDIMDGEQNLAQFKTETVDGKTFTVIESTTDTDRGVRLTSSPTNANNLADAYIQTTSNNYNQGGADFGEGSFDALSRSNDNTTERTLLSRIFSDTSRISTTLNLFASWVQNAGSSIISRHEAAIRMLSNSSKSQVLIDADEVKVNSHDITFNGECVSIAGNSGEVTLSTSAANYLTGRCQTWQTSDKYEDVYEVSLNPTTIKAKKKGMYLVTMSGYFTTNFTANDIIHINLERQQSGSATWTAIGFAGYVGRVTNASWYQRVDCVGYVNLDVGDTVRMTAYNQTGARGRINVNNNTNLQIIKIY